MSPLELLKHVNIRITFNNVFMKQIVRLNIDDYAKNIAVR